LESEPANDELTSALGLTQGPGDQMKVGAHVFLLCALLHLLGCMVYSGGISMLPIWLVLTAARGGLQKSSVECAVIFSAVVLALFMLRSTCALKAGEVVRLSPVRAARIASAVVLLSCLTIPILCLRFSKPSGIIAAFFALAFPVSLLTVLVGAVYIYRRASSSLFFVCLSASFTSPSTIVHFVSSLSDIVVRYTLELQFIFKLINCNL
jgi:hypothetical protein